MTAFTTVPAAKAALLAMLQGVSELNDDPDVIVRWGVPATVAEHRTRVYIDRVTEHEAEWFALGAGRMREQYTFRVLIEVVRTGDDYQSAEEAMWEAHAVVVQTIRSDYTLSGTVQQATPRAADEQELGPADQESLISRVALAVECTARV